MGELRTGRVSSIDYASGSYEVTYSDRGESVTSRIPAISNGEYRMPKIGDMVSVMHLSNGAAEAIALGTFWNASNTPEEGREGLYRKEFGSSSGKAYERYDEATGGYSQVADGDIERKSGGNISDEAEGEYLLKAKGAKADITGDVTLNINGAEIMIAADGSITVTSPSKISLSAPVIDIQGTGGNVNVNRISLTEHTHENGGSGRPQ